MEKVSKDKKGLPECCYLKQDNRVVMLRRGVSGYFEVDGIAVSAVDEINRLMGVTPAEVMAMKVGSMFGWDLPGADPSLYDENGKLR